MRLVADTSEIAGLARKLEAGNAAMDGVIERSINKVGRRAYTGSVREIVSQVRLTAAYVRDKMEYRPASKNRPYGQIVARRRATRLATYASRQLVQSAPKAKGDPMRGIAAGQKQAGIVVGVKRNVGQKKQRSFFYIPLIRGDDKSSAGANGVGVFVRTGPRRDDIKHLYGPSVDQVFSQIIPDLAPEISKELHDELQREGMRSWNKAINP